LIHRKRKIQNIHTWIFSQISTTNTVQYLTCPSHRSFRYLEKSLHNTLKNQADWQVAENENYKKKIRTNVKIVREK
jgi:hypothetical protein